MQVVRTISELRDEVGRARASGTPVGAGAGAGAGSGGRIGLVPTMGFLHEGHLSLVDRCREHADFSVMSIYVNPLQFGPNEDLGEYPRDLERDLALAETRGVDLVFAPDDRELYPAEPVTTVVPRRLAERLCGLSRPGHFEGVLTIVAKLLGIVQPDVSVFGQKDFQQSVLIRRMVEDLNMPVRIEIAPTVREPDGLAMSSRNTYLSPEERTRALTLSRGLAGAASAYRSGERAADALVERVGREMTDAGLQVDYAECVDSRELEPVSHADDQTVLAVAAHVGGTRLIDNVILAVPDPGLEELLHISGDGI